MEGEGINSSKNGTLLLQHCMYLTDILGSDFGFDFDACRNKIDLIILDLTNG